MNQTVIVMLSMATASIATAQAPSVATPSLPEARPDIALPGNGVAPSSSPHQDPVTTPTTAAGPIETSPKQAGKINPDPHRAKSGKSALSGSPSAPASPLGPSFLKLDTNHDGVLTIEEMNATARNGRSVGFKQMDKDHDGKISAAEYSAAQDEAARQSQKGLPGSTTSDPTGEAHASRPPGSKPPGSSQQ